MYVSITVSFASEYFLARLSVIVASSVQYT